MSAPITELIAAVHAAGGAIERQGREIRLTAPTPLPNALVIRLREAKPALLAHLHNPVVEPLINKARSYDAVLVADGSDLVVIERWLSELPLSTLRALVADAANVIALLRAESRARTAGDEDRP